MSDSPAPQPSGAASPQEPAELLDQLLESLFEDFCFWFERGLVLLEHTPDQLLPPGERSSLRHDLQEARFLPGLGDLAFDVSDTVDVNSWYGAVLKGVFNFSPVPQEFYRLPLPAAGEWREVLNSDATTYGGTGVGNLGTIHAKDEPFRDQPASAVLRLPPLGALYFTR